MSLSNFVSFFIDAISQTIILVLIWSIVTVYFADHDMSLLKSYSLLCMDYKVWSISIKTHVWVVDKELKLVDFASRWCSCRGCSCCSSSCGRGWSWCWSSSWSTVSVTVSVASATTTSATAAASINRDKDGCSKDTSKEFHFFKSFVLLKPIF